MIQLQLEIAVHAVFHILLIPQPQNQPNINAVVIVLSLFQVHIYLCLLLVLNCTSDPLMIGSDLYVLARQLAAATLTTV
jgi:hypothetical protein